MQSSRTRLCSTFFLAVLLFGFSAGRTHGATPSALRDCRGVNENVLICNIDVAPDSGANLQLGAPVHVSFDYLAARRFVVILRPYSQGQPTNDGTQPTIILPAGQGRAASSVTVTSGPAVVDEIRLTVLEQNTGERVGQIAASVRYLFGDFSPYFNPNTIAVSSPSGHCLENGDLVSVSFNYRAPRRVWIYALPVTGNDVTDGRTSPDSPGDEPAGEGRLTRSFSIGAGPAHVGRILIRMWDYETREVLHDHVIDVDYNFGVCTAEVTDIEVVPASPACLQSGQQASVSFRYSSVEPVEFQAIPMTGGGFTPGFRSPFAPYPAGNSTNAQVRFSVDTLSATVERVRIRMLSLATGAVLAEAEVDVEIRIGNDYCHTFNNFRFNPDRQAGLCLDQGERVEVALDYWSPQLVRISAVPMEGDRQAPHIQPDSERVLAAGRGSATASFFIAPGQGTIDRVDIRMWDEGGEELLLSQTIQVSYHYGCAELRPFRRGDVDGDGRVHYMDAFYTIFYLYIGSWTPQCMDAADMDDNGIVDPADPVTNLVYFFFPGTVTIPAPGHLTCGVDPTPDAAEVDGELGCEYYPEHTCQ